MGILLWLKYGLIKILHCLLRTTELAFACLKVKDQVVEKLTEVTPSHQNVVAAIERLFPENKILPYHIPTYLQHVLNVNTVATDNVDLDIDVQGVAQAINAEALSLMDSPHQSDLVKSKMLLESLAMIKEDDPNVYYNLACADSLLKDVQSSIQRLRIALEKGYSAFKHLLEDPDLTYLRSQDQFVNLVAGFLSSQPPVFSASKSGSGEKLEGSLEEKPIALVEPEKSNESSAEIKVDAPLPEKPERWGDEIEVLKGMGFQLQNSVFIDVLDHHKGSLESAVQDLI